MRTPRGFFVTFLALLIRKNYNNTNDFLPPAGFSSSN